jgi:hypothetical protein
MMVMTLPGRAQESTTGFHEVWSLDHPAVGTTYEVTGEARQTNATGGFLQMWSVFGEARYFSRAPLPEGSEWRSFRLPFQAHPGMVPDTLILEVVTPTGGTAEVRNVQLRSIWWSAAGGGWLGGLGGSLLGLMGALAGWLTHRRQGRRVVFSLLGLSTVLAIPLLIAGIVAVTLGQPYGVYYPLLLLGGLGTAIPLASWRAFRRQYETDELQRMRAMDAS